MKEMLNMLGKYKWTICLILILLLVQAFLDLSLPGLTSQIVDVGIAQSGIEDNVPRKWRKSEFEKVLELVEDKELLSSSYECDLDICELTQYSEELSNMLVVPELVLLEGNVEDIEELRKKYKGNESLVSSKVIEYPKLELEALDIEIDDYAFKYITKTGLKMLVIASITMAVTFVSVYLSSKVMANFGKDLRVKIVSKIMSFESEEINKISVSSLITRCTNDVIQVSALVMVFLRIVVYAPIIGAGALVKVSSNGVSYLVGVPIICILVVMVTLFVKVIPKMRLFQELLDRLTVVSREILSGIPVIRAFTNEKKEEERFEIENEAISKNSLYIDRSVALLNPTLTFIINSVSILIVWVCASKIDSGVMGVGEMIAMISYVLQISMAFLMISMVAVMIPRSIVSIKRISEVFNTSVSVKDKEDSLELKNIDSIELDNVSFRYSGSSKDVLKNITLKVNSGESIGIIGSTGSGKSTLVNLIPRFRDVSSGSILINGKDIREYKIKDLRNNIGYVPQKSWLESGTIKSNICFGVDSDENIEEALRVSMSKSVVSSKEEGLVSRVSEGGSNLSGGEKQRLSIARALIKNPSVLILDDAMNALDYKTDANLRKELKKISKNSILFVTTQRIASVINMDKIIVIDNGEIVGIGSHKELVQSCKIYREIKISQLGGEE